MKLRFNRQEIADALSALCSVAATRTPKDILKCVYLDAQADVLFLAATDLELSLKCAVTQVEIDKQGKAVVMADILNKIVHEANDETMTLNTDATQLHVKGQGSHFKMVTHEVDEFPHVPVMDGDPTFSADTKSLLRQIEWTVQAAARETSRFAINGVLWELEGDRLTLAATDGRRLSVAPGHAEVVAKVEDTISVIVPSKALNIFTRMAGDHDGPINVAVTDSLMIFNVGTAQLATSLVEGSFPNYRDVIPSDCDQVAVMDKVEFHGALKQASLLTNEESKGVRLTFANGDLTISSRAPEQGEATVSIPVKYKHDALEIGFNPVFLLDVLKVVDTEEVSLAMKDGNRPGLLRSAQDFVYVVMPVSLKSA
ncbi:MAG: DNA polymerase III subunit beta [Planctomycetota bacterium]|jgi:DNA polymerase-3 subunit beta